MESAEIRSRWLRFFEERGHTVVPSASLIAQDPTLLLVNAGMVPFKPFFLGEVPPPYLRATSVQKCVRTLDIDEVGKTTRHASFFQMCGNFSFGDYFKETAIPLAWELLTSPVADGGFGLAADRLWVTVYLDDDEAEQIWRDVVGVPADRIQRRGMADNYWSMGVPGPCGPCSEIFYDRGPDYGVEGGPIADEDRYVEIWNLVFMQFERGMNADGKVGKDSYPILGELPSKNIDTGLGLERLATILQGVENLYEIDTTRQILDKAVELTGKTYGADEPTDVRLRVVADHARTAVMLIGDGVTPGNEGRGYVLRRMMRRVVRNMRLLGAHAETTVQLAEAAIGAMAPQYPELDTDRERILSITAAEEKSFAQTLERGTAQLEQAIGAGSSATTLSAGTAFELHDTFGFPIDLTLEMAAEHGVSVDEDGFRRLMKEQRDRAKADARAKKTGHVDVSAYRGFLDTAGSTEFTGYDHVANEALVRGLLRDGVVASSAAEGDDVELVLDRTPFYAEGGGQLADQGLITLADGSIVEVHDVQSPVGGLIVHRGVVRSGEVVTGAGALAQVDIERRHSISRAHTATHLVHKAIRDALGETATQAGSENAPGRFRFDFSSTGAVPASVLADVEQTVNEVLAADLAVHAEVMTQDQARSIGAMALFGEKYGDRVRVVSVGDWARELCGGTHASSSGQLGLVKLLGESSIGSGVRRVEALVGVDAYRFLAREHVLLAQVTEVLKGRPEEMPERVAALVAKLKDAEREIDRMKSDALRASTADLASQAIDVDGVAVLAVRAPDGTDANGVRQLVLDARGDLAARPAVVVGGADTDGKAALVAATNDAAQDRGLSANDVLKAVLPHVEGRGGGKKDVAQGGGPSTSGLGAALDAVEAAVRAGLGA